MQRVKVFDYRTAATRPSDEEVDKFVNTLVLAEHGLNFTESGLLFIAGTDKTDGLDKEDHITARRRQIASHYARMIQATASLKIATYKAGMKTSNVEEASKNAAMVVQCENDLNLAKESIKVEKSIIKQLEAGELTV